MENLLKEININIVLIKYNYHNEFSDSIVISDTFENILSKIKDLLNDHIKMYYTRENVRGEFYNEIDLNVVDTVFYDMNKKCNLAKDKILIEIYERLKYVKISYSICNPKNGKNIYNLDFLKPISYDSEFLQINPGFSRGSYIIYYHSIKKSNLLKSKKTDYLTRSQLTVYNLISKSTYPLSREDIVEYTSLSPRTASYAVSRLISLNYIKKINISQNNTLSANKMNRYVISTDIQ